MEWPLMTIAMLSGEKKVCIPSEAIVFSECVDAYAWMIRETVHMTPCVRMSDIKVIFGDGILGGESLVHILGTQSSCRIVLDHHHLLSEDIGAWPKKFGGATWVQIKEDCTELVKKYEKESYLVCLDRIRTQSEFDCVHWKKHHQKRHLLQTTYFNIILLTSRDKVMPRQRQITRLFSGESGQHSMNHR
jgi:hypothetical protein